MNQKTTENGLCKCGCGNKTRIAHKTIKRLGWVKGEHIQFIHGHNRRLDPKDSLRIRYPKEYATWENMKKRCYNSSEINYSRYGSQGIIICDRWLHNFANFLTDMGPCPPDFSIDRIDSSGNYTPDNCRWSSPFIQAINKKKQPLGYSYDKKSGKWQARIRVDNKLKTLGYYQDKKEAISVYLDAEKDRLLYYLARDAEILRTYRNEFPD